MVKVFYPTRIFADSYFLASVGNNIKLLSPLMYIHASSGMCRKMQNVVLATDGTNAVDSKVISDGKLRAAFSLMEIPPFLKDEQDEFSRNIKFCISLAGEPPYQTTLLTTPEKQHLYLNNKHYNHIKSVFIKSGIDAEILIEYYYKRFITARDAKSDLEY